MKFRKFLILTGKKFSAAYQAFLTAVGADGGTVEAKAYTDALLQTAENASIVQIPSAYKAAVLYNQVPTPTGQDFTVARASDVIRTNESGVLESLGSNVPCIDHSDGFPVLLTQPQSTNLVTYSNDFSDAYWLKSGGGTADAPLITPNFGTSPDGLQNADRVQLELNGGVASGDISQITGSITTTLVDNTTSIYIKSNDNNNYPITIVTVAGNNVTFTADQEWKRVETTGLASTTSNSFRLRTRGSEGSSDSTDILVYQAQIEPLSYATTIIPTSGATATRLGDVISGAGSTASINSEEGVMHVDCATFVNGGEGLEISLSDGTIDNRASLVPSFTVGRLDFVYRVGGVTVTQIFSGTGLDKTIINSYDIKWKLNDFELFVNGVSVATNTSGAVAAANTFNTLEFARGNGSSNPFYGKTKQLRVYESIADAQIDLPYIT